MTNFLGIKITNKDGKQLTEDVCPLRTFKSGKSGYGLYGKLSDITTGERYQMSINIVKIVAKEDKPGAASPVKLTKDATLMAK